MEGDSVKRTLLTGKPQRYGSALGLYIALSIYLYWPYMGGFRPHQFLFLINPVVAAWGTYFLSKRWVNNWTPSVLAGAVYGFSPFALSFAALQQPVAELSFVMVPWLFLPAVFWHKNKQPDAFRFCMRTLFCLLPFTAVAGMFWAASQKWAGPYFLMPAGASLTGDHFLDLIFPLFGKGPHLTFGIYHASLVLAMMGLFVLVKVQRITVLLPVAAAMILCFLRPVLGVPPIIWAAVPVLFLSLLSGLGFQSIFWAGKADSKWVLTCALAASVLTAFFGGLAYKRMIHGNLLEGTALVYAVTAVGLWLLFFFIHANLRWKPAKWAILTAIVVFDLVFSARYLVDKLF